MDAELVALGAPLLAGAVWVISEGPDPSGKRLGLGSTSHAAEFRKVKGMEG